MNRAQFMKQLEKLLSDISEEERKEALDYYERDRREKQRYSGSWEALVR